jgi:hypothetical protein
MGQQQLLLIILGVIIVGIAIAVGLSLFTSQSIQSNKDAIINDINNLAASAYQYRIRPASMGGGAGSFTGWTIPVKMSSNENGGYSIGSLDGSGVSIVGTSSNNTGNTITGHVGSDGRVSMTPADDFQGEFK